MKLSPNLPLPYVLFFQKDVFIRKEELQRKREGEAEIEIFTPQMARTPGAGPVRGQELLPGVLMWVLRPEHLSHLRTAFLRNIRR